MQTLIKTLATARVKPFVSVVTPTWNRGAFLPYLLYMYRYQDYPADRRELIILDDSPQSHQHIIDRLTNGTPGSFNIRYIHHPEKLPLGKKRNMLNELARGEYILCMDDDDSPVPTRSPSGTATSTAFSKAAALAHITSSMAPFAITVTT